jgi:cation transport regulator ChaB
MPASEELPDTLRRSDKHAQALWSKSHDGAVDSYGEGERAHRTAFAALKREYEKVGDHWERKAESGPSDERSQGKNTRQGKTHGGVDATATKSHLLQLARRLDVPGRSTMSKPQLVDALEKANASESRKAQK